MRSERADRGDVHPDILENATLERSKAAAKKIGSQSGSSDGGTRVRATRWVFRGEGKTGRGGHDEDN